MSDLERFLSLLESLRQALIELGDLEAYAVAMARLVPAEPTP